MANKRNRFLLIFDILRPGSSDHLYRLLSQSSLGGRFAKGAFWSLVGTGIAQGLAMIAAIFTARLLGKIGYGEFGIINSTTGTFGIFAGLGLGFTATKYVAEWRSKDPVRTGRIIGLLMELTIGSALLLSGLLFFLSPTLAKQTLQAPHLTDMLRLGCILLFFNALSGVQTGVLSGLEAFKTITRVNLMRGLANFPIMMAGVWLFGLAGAVAATVIVGVIGWVLNQVAIEKECRKSSINITYRQNMGDLPILWTFSLPAFIVSATVAPVLWIANTIIAKLPGGYGELGIINAATQWRMILLFVPSAVSNVALPTMISVFSDHGYSEQSNKSIEIANALNQMALWPVSILVMFLALPILNLYGKGFEDGKVLFVLFIGGTAIGYVSNVIGTLFFSRGFAWIAALQNSLWGIILIGITYVGVPVYSAIAFGWANVISYIILLIFSVIYWNVKKEIPPTLSYRIMKGGFVMLSLVLFAAFLPANVSIILAIPLAILSMPLSIYFLTTPEIHATFRNFLRFSHKNITS